MKPTKLVSNKKHDPANTLPEANNKSLWKLLVWRQSFPFGFRFIFKGFKCSFQGVQIDWSMEKTLVKPLHLRIITASLKKLEKTYCRTAVVSVFFSKVVRSPENLHGAGSPKKIRVFPLWRKRSNFDTNSLPQKLTRNLKIGHPKKEISFFQPSIFRGVCC